MTWLLDAREQIRADNRRDPAFNEIDTTCNFVEGGSTSNDSKGRYLDLKITLEVTDKDGDQNKTERTVKLYTNGHCGF